MEAEHRGKTFQFENEDHTLGNVLRTTLSFDSRVEFAGYSLPHWTQALMNLRVQCSDDKSTPDECLSDALDVVEVVSAKVLEALEIAVKDYEDTTGKKIHTRVKALGHLTKDEKN